MELPTRYQFELNRARLSSLRSLVPVLVAAHLACCLVEVGLSTAGFDLPMARNNLMRLAVVPLLGWVWYRSGRPQDVPPLVLAWMALVGFALSHGIIAANVDISIGFPLFAGSGWMVVTGAGFIPGRFREALGLGLAVAAVFTLSFVATAQPMAMGPLFLAPLGLVLMIAPLLACIGAVCLEQNLAGPWDVRSEPASRAFPVAQDTPEEVVSFITDLLEESGKDGPDSTEISRRSAPVPETNSWSPSLKQPVLVVENGLAQQKLTCRLLGRLGYESVVVSSGPDAVEAVLSRSFSLVLMDGPMPGMDGYEAVRLIRAVGTENCRVPIVGMLSQSEAEENAERALNCGMDDWVEKPLSLEDLKATLTRWARGRAIYP